MGIFLQDIRNGLRLFAKNRGLTLALVLSLALGVGATASVFSLVDAFLFRPLPVPQAKRVVRITSVTQSTQTGNLSLPEFEDLRNRAKSFEGVAAVRNFAVGLAAAAGAQPRMTLAVFVNGDFFSTMRVQPAAGRGFLPDEDLVPGRDRVAVISYGLWQGAYGGRGDVAGETVRLDSREFTIVGVAPQSFDGIDPFLHPEVYVPRMMIDELSRPRENALGDRTARIMGIYARLKPGITIDQARREADGISAQIAQEHPESNRGYRMTAFSQLDYRLAENPDELAIASLFLAIASLVLGIACVNVANLLFSTAPARTREIAVRIAMGANRTRLVRQMLVENLLLSAAASLIGLVIAELCAKFIRGFQIASNLPIRLNAEVDLRVVLFAFTVGIGSGILSGLIPALRCSRANLSALLRSTDIRAGRSRMWGRQALIVTQVAVALIVLVLSGLALQDLRILRSADPGFRVDRVLTMTLDPGTLRYDNDRTRRFYRDLLSRVRALPGVQDACIGLHMPLGVSSSTADVVIPEYAMPNDQQSLPISSSIVSDGYFETLGIPIVRGRAFDTHDTQDAPRVAIANEEMVRKYWPTRDPLGTRIEIKGTDGGVTQIIGIARNAKYREFDEKPTPFLYIPVQQNNAASMVLFVAADGDPAALIPSVRGEIRAIDPSQPIYDIRTMSQQVRQQALWGDRLSADILSAVGSIGLLLGVLGLYGVLAYAVSQRTHEIGIRMAIGATSTVVQRMVLLQGLKLSAAGIVIGLILIMSVMPLVSGVIVTRANPYDPAVYSAVVVLLLGVTLLACYLPARRASRVDPNECLRCE